MYTSHTSYFTYIVECADGSYYTGKTYDLIRRLKQHNGLLKGGAKYTRNRQPVKLIYYEVYITNQLACQREAYLKQLTHKQKEELIKYIL